MNSFIDNLNPTLFSWTATIIGTILCEQLTELEQNSIGNWLVLLGDYLLTNAAQLALVEDTKTKNIPTNEDKINLLMQTMETIKQELENLKKQ